MELNFIVFDLEATCWRGPVPKGHHEVIEIGALKMDFTGEVVGYFSRFVKPDINPLLSPFCKSLTGITQEEIDQAASFKLVIQDFIDWSNVDDDHSYLISWGENDYHYLMNDCRWHNIDSSWVQKHVDLRKHFKQLKRLNNYVSLKKAMAMENIEFTGNRHRALDDAINLGKIFQKYIDEWTFN